MTGSIFIFLLGFLACLAAGSTGSLFPTGDWYKSLNKPSVYAIMAVWDSVTDADRNIANSSIFKQYKNRSRENWTLYLKPTRSLGSWDKRNPFEITDNLNQTFPVVALTRATIKTSILLKFWKRVPDISKTIGLNKNVLFKIGLGEIPWFHQVTFSIWPNQESMDQFARNHGPHKEAIKAVRENNWFKEELYARFAIEKQIGQWPEINIDKEASE